MTNLALAVCAVVVGVAATTACSQRIVEVPCDQLQLGSADAAAMILTDGRSPALDRTVGRLLDDPETLFGSADLGLDAPAGIVAVTTTDANGNIDDVGVFNLGGADGDNVRRRANARNQSRCLGAAVDTLTTAPDTTDGGANLLRALPTASAILTSLDADRVALVVHGFGRSDNDGFVPAVTDLSPAARPRVLATLEAASVVPQLDIPVVLLAPTEGLPSGIAAADVRAFVAEELCPHLSTVGCTAVDALG